MKDIIVPTLGESVTQAIVAKWLKNAGEQVKTDEPILELETDKVTLEVPSPCDGALSEIVANEGDEVELGAILGRIDENAKGSVAVSTDTPPKTIDAPVVEKKVEAAPVDAPKTSPAVRKLLAENGIDASLVPATNGRITKAAVLEFIEKNPKKSAPSVTAASIEGDDGDERVPMTSLRKIIARRLKESQNTAATLTTFNEVDMTAVMAARSAYKEAFEKRHGTRLGFMGFFIIASLAALREFPSVGAQIDGDDIVYRKHHNIGVAVSTEQGLVVPVVKKAEDKSIAQIEAEVLSFGKKAREGALSMADMTDGTFTITNGGVFGSLLSTPILNPPQSGILGLHKISKRPMVMPNGEIEARPMMYLALSYDHRIVDGKESVSFLAHVKASIEDPQRMLLEI